MNTQEQSTSNTRSDDASPKRGTRRLGFATVVGLTAVAGIGLAVQSASAAQVSQAPAGAQLPWDDSDAVGPSGSLDRPHDDRGRMEAMHDRMHQNPGGHMGDHMDDHMGPGKDRQPKPGVEGRGVGLRELLETAADVLGISVEDLVAEIRSGKSIAEVAESSDVPVQDVIDALVEKVMAQVTERITALVNQTPPPPQD